MAMIFYLSIAVILLATSTQRSFVDTAPLAPQTGSPEIVPQYQDDNVKELENLKHTLGKTLQMMKSHSAVYTNINGEQEGHSDTKQQLNEDGKLVARLGQHVDRELPGPDGNPSMRVRTDVDIPSKGIHKSVVQQLDPELQSTENGNRRSNIDGLQDSNSLEKYGSYSGIQYSPLDMAEYVFWTGDEKGVTLAIEEFLQEGMMTREEAISFLQEIKYNLDYLQSHYTQLGLNARDRSKENEKIQNGLFFNKMHSQKPELTNNFDLTQLRQEVVKKNTPHVASAYNNKGQDRHNQKQNQEEYSELLEKLRVADFLYTEYSLEEVIYQLAKVMFTQSLTRGSSEAQQALQKFTSFLETEADQGRISKALEKKVLDVLIAALTDTLTEHPELGSDPNFNQAQRNVENQNILRQILALSPEEKANVKAALSTYKDQARDNQVQIQLKNDKNVDHLSLGIGKYKNP